jgi:hypothetical protein
MCVMAMLCLNTTILQAQNNSATMPIYPHQNFTDAFDSLFMATTKSYITTGALYNRVIPYACNQK